MSTSIKGEKKYSLMQENIDLICWVAELQMENDKLRDEIELLIDLIKIEEI